jgi:hypothetical protein
MVIVEFKPINIVKWDRRNLTGGPVASYAAGVGGPVLFQVDNEKIIGINRYYKIVHWDLSTKERYILANLPLSFSESDTYPCSVVFDYTKIIASWEQRVSIYKIV